VGSKVFAASGAGGALAGLLIAAILICLYFLPLIVAGARHVPNVGSVAVINIFLGWTFIGWVVALAMAMRSTAVSTAVHVYGAPATPTAPAGWYPDPYGQAAQRYFDGQQWTSYTA
jgi:hypothetical protein